MFRFGVLKRFLAGEIARCTAAASVYSARTTWVLSFDDIFHVTSARHRAVEPEQWLQRHPAAGSP